MSTATERNPSIFGCRHCGFDIVLSDGVLHCTGCGCEWSIAIEQRGETCPTAHHDEAGAASQPEPDTEAARLRFEPVGDTEVYRFTEGGEHIGTLVLHSAALAARWLPVLERATDAT